jgi:hypothetical protein
MPPFAGVARGSYKWKRFKEVAAASLAVGDRALRESCRPKSMVAIRRSDPRVSGLARAESVWVSDVCSGCHRGERQMRAQVRLMMTTVPPTDAKEIDVIRRDATFLERQQNRYASRADAALWDAKSGGEKSRYRRRCGLFMAGRGV